ncbi:hypothetical protein [Mucilaginibacter sp.]|uniref:hypothetical protein n=1 Tax=Mucilaginibacter sp. TaxID=1882438 RepID=UPI00261DA54E|nr:hypothetical protein [Mucilaginibacter sp.]MDB5128339.1 hypothetical protein [Mucilaginibacter sp.]
MKKSHAPDPIKLNYYEVELGKSRGKTFEERLELLRKIGADAVKDFPERYKSLGGWFKKYDQLNLLSFCFYYFMMSPAGYDEEAVTGGLEFPPYYLELLQAFALTIPRTLADRPLSNEVETFKKDFKEIGELIKLRHYHFPSSIKTEDDLYYHQLRIDMMSHTIAVRNWSYEHKMKKVTLDLARGVKIPFIAKHGFDPEALLDLLYAMTDEVEKKVNIHRQKTAEIMRPDNYKDVIDTFESLFPGMKSDGAQKEFLWTHNNMQLRNLQGFLLLHSDRFLPELFSFHFLTLEEMSGGKLSYDQIKFIFKELSLSFDDLKDHNPEYFLLTNPVHDRPFINVANEGIFSSLWTVLPHLSIGLLEKFCATDEDLRHKYNEVRAKYLEDEVHQLFGKSFPGAQLFTGSKFEAVDGKEYENDLLVIMDSFALVVESKSGQVSPPAKRAAPDRLLKTLQELIEDPSEQALRFISYLRDHPESLELDTKKGPKNKFDAGKLKYFIPLGVTLSHLGMMGANLKQLIRGGVTKKTIEELAPSINLTDLQIVFDLLPLTAEKVHYLQRRRELEANIQWAGDELDLLAWYFDNGFNLGPDEKKYSFFNVSLKSKELDNYIIGSSNREDVEKPELIKTKWWKDLLNHLEKRRVQSWLENSYILLNIPIEGQEVFEEQIDLIKKKMENGTADYPHNWSLMGSSEENRRFLIAGYLYSDKVAYERREVMEDIIFHEQNDEAKGIMVIGRNIDQSHYPYSLLGCRLSAELFDNRYLQMVRPENGR